MKNFTNSKFFVFNDIFLIILVLIYSGNPAPGRWFSLEPQLILIALFLSILLFLKQKKLFTSDLLIFIWIFSVIFTVQCVELSFYPYITFFGFLTRLYIGYALVRIVQNFLLSFVHSMLILSILSFIFYIPYLIFSLLGISIENEITFLSKFIGIADLSRRPLLFHTFAGYSSLRNFGIFWEPGAFQGYLILALIFLSIIKQELLRKHYTDYLVILSIAVLSTFSTTGYISLFFIFFLHYNWKESRLDKIFDKIFIIFVILIPISFFVAFFAYKAIPFLGNKIEHQIKIIEFQDGRWHRSRIGSLFFDWQYINKRLLTGWGLHSNTRFSLHPWMENSEGMGNGFSDFIVKFGIIGFLSWFVLVYNVFYQKTDQNKILTVFICGIILIELQGEVFLAYPIYLSLAFIKNDFNKNIKTKLKVYNYPIKIKLLRNQKSLHSQ